jgi:diacylglycerol kinase (ATP)
MPNRHYIFVVNRKSGNPRHGRTKVVSLEDVIAEACIKYDIAHSFVFLPDKSAAEKVHGIIAKNKVDGIVAAGGDGTVTFAANIVRGTVMKLGIIPAGSANGMATELNIPADVGAAMEIINGGKVMHCDMIAIRGKGACLHLSDVGLNARLVKYFQQGPARGKFGYFRALLKVLMKKRRMVVRVEAKSESIVRDAVMVLLANATKYGTGAVINPQGSINDGLFEVVIIKHIGIGSILKMFFRFGRFNPRKIEVLPAERILITSRHPVHFQVDGEYLGKVTEIEALIQPSVLNLIVPDN